jgi:UrcA family protein
MIMKSQRHLLIGLTAFAAVLTTHLAAATPAMDSDTKTHVVRYSDLDLSRPQDVQQLYARMQRAAKLVCDDYAGGSLHSYTAYNRCVAHAMSDGIAQLRAQQPSLYAKFSP